jgi:hypothetical protein
MHTYKITALRDCTISGEIHMGLVPNPWTNRPEAIVERGILTLKAGEEKTEHMSLDHIKCAAPIEAHQFLKVHDPSNSAAFLEPDTWPNLLVIEGLVKIERISQ